LSKQYSKSKKDKRKNTAGAADVDDNASADANANSNSNPDSDSNPNPNIKPGKGIITIKERTPEERKKNHIEGIIKTVVASMVGIVAGFISFNQFGTAEDTTWYAILTIIAVLAYYAQRLIFPAIKINTKEFGLKGWFYVEFLVIDFCLVTWILLLN